MDQREDELIPIPDNTENSELFNNFENEISIESNDDLIEFENNNELIFFEDDLINFNDDELIPIHGKFLIIKKKK
jgi:hypothetical protein